MHLSFEIYYILKLLVYVLLNHKAMLHIRVTMQ